MPDTRHVNTVDHSFTPTAGALKSILNVKNVREDPRPEVLTSSGSGDYYNSLKLVVGEDPIWTLDLEYQAILVTATGLLIGTVGVFTYKVRGAHNKIAVAGGGFSVTVANAVITGMGAENPHKQVATNQLMIEAESDGVTSPKTTSAF